MKRYLWMNIVLMSLLGISLASCSKNDGGGEGPDGGGEWFVDKLNTSFHEDDTYILERIDQLFDSNGLYCRRIELPNGMVSYGPAGYNEEIEAIHVTNNTVEKYSAFLYRYNSPGTVGKRLLYRITGSALGDVGYYISSPDEISNCTRDGNVLTITQGGITSTLTITSYSLLGKNGDQWTKVSFGQTYNDNFKAVDKSDIIADAKTISKSVVVVGDPTFHKVTFRCSFGTSNKGKTYTRVFAFSKNKADLEDAESLGKRYFKLTGVRTIHYPPTYATNFNVIYATGDNGYVEDGDLRFVDEGTADLNNFSAVYDELGTTIYYCPVIIVASDVAVVGDINSVTMRKLKQTSGYVDLGLSCLWSATNYQASSPWDFGHSIALYDKNVKDGGRIPSKDEAMELNKCKLEAIDNGILVTGLNGNEIFIPIRDTSSKLISGYGTTSSQYKDLYERDVLFSFDSSKNKFISFTSSSITRHASAYVRPVKNGGGGGSYDNPSDKTYISLKDLLKSPMGIANLDLATTSLADIANGLAQKYTLSSEYIGEWWCSCEITTSANPDCAKIYLADIMSFNFQRLYVSGVPTSFSSASYDFVLKKSDWTGFTTDMFLSVVKAAYSNIGIPLIEETNNPAGMGELYYYDGNKMYRVTMYDDEPYWRFAMSVYIS